MDLDEVVFVLRTSPRMMVSFIIFRCMLTQKVYHIHL